MRAPILRDFRFDSEQIRLKITGDGGISLQGGGVLAGPAWAARWPLGREVGHVKRKRRQPTWAFIKVPAHGQ
jgi:hypothetical protein